MNKQNTTSPSDQRECKCDIGLDGKKSCQKFGGSNLCWDNCEHCSLKQSTENWEEEFDKRFTFGGITGTVALRTDNAFEIKSFIKQTITEEVKRERERIANLIHERKRIYHKDCLTDSFINGRFWECQELWEILSSLSQESKEEKTGKEI